MRILIGLMPFTSPWSIWVFTLSGQLAVTSVFGRSDMAIAMCSDHKKVLDLLAPDEDGGYGISEKNIPADLKSP